MTVRLTEYSHGAGCGCKLSISHLEEILRATQAQMPNPMLLVGNETKDDAAAYDLGNGTAVLSTTDFFMPIVDDPFTFGRIAATNAISDIYAMGGNPLMAIAIFGWPIDKLSTEVASQVIAGGKKACQDAGIPLAGGHSIDSPEPIFGLAVTGIVSTDHLKRNHGANEDCALFITKPLGIGILTTAQKRQKIKPDHITPAIEAMCSLNTLGQKVAHLKGVKAMTDITGFGLMGHLIEMCEASQVSAHVYADQVPVLPNVPYYVSEGCISGGTLKNFKSYGHQLSDMSEAMRHIVCDAQTSGGLLIAVAKDSVDEFLRISRENGHDPISIGHTSPLTDPLIQVIE